MKECKGLFGRIFGHCFVSRITKYESNPIGGSVTGYSLDDLAEAYADKEYVVVCKRCGLRK